MEDIEQLYHLYSSGLYKYLFFLCGDKFTAEELLQETFYQAIVSIHRFKGNSKISTWLYQIGKNVYFKDLSRTKKENRNSDMDLDALSLVQNAPENIYETKEERTMLIQVLYELDEQSRDIVLLRLFDELSFRDIGRLFNQSEGWARTHFYRTKLALRKLIQTRKGDVTDGL